MSTKVPPGLAQHPLFAAGKSFGLISGEHPRYRGDLVNTGHEGLRAQLRLMGLKFEDVAGNYDGPERALAVYGPSREQMFDLGRKWGQESIIWGHNHDGHPGMHAELLYTNGPHAGKAHLGHDTVPLLEHFPTHAPENYSTQVPGGQAGHFRLNFDMDKLHPVPLSVGTQHPQALAPASTPRPDLTKNLDDAAARRSPAAWPGAYPWHDGHTGHNSLHAAPGAVLVRKNDGGRTDQSLMANQFHLGGSFAKGAITDPQLGLQPLKGSFATTMRDHNDGSLGKDEVKPQQPQSAGETPHAASAGGPNEQAAGAGAPTYAHFAAPFGSVNPREPSNLRHYRYEGQLANVQRQVKDHGFQTYLAGGQHGKPDLANRNYNTKHLMVYDPTPASGGDFGDEQYTHAWRAQHELAHALTYPAINAKYGEGRRIGKLGVHRTANEARRAVEWEWLAGHRQRQLAEQMGVHLSDDDFAREMNTIMHDAAHRAVTGKFTEPGAEGFRPHSHLVPLETALGLVNEHAQRLNLSKAEKPTCGNEHPDGASCELEPEHEGDHEARHGLWTWGNTAPKKPKAIAGGGQTTPPRTGHLRVVKSQQESQSTPAAAITERVSMAKFDEAHENQYTPEQARVILLKALQERIGTYAQVLADLRKREGLAKEGQQLSMTPNGVAQTANTPQVSKAELGKVAPPGREDQVRALKPQVGAASAFKIAWASYNHGKDARKSVAGGPGLNKDGMQGFGGSENVSPPSSLTMAEKTANGTYVRDDPPESKHPFSEGRKLRTGGSVCRHCGEGIMHERHDPPKGGWSTKKADQPSGAGAVLDPTHQGNLNAAEPDGGHLPDARNLREKQSVPVRTEDPRSNAFVTAGNNGAPTTKAEPGDSSAWSKVKTKDRSDQAGWDKHGMFHCPHCSTMIAGRGAKLVSASHLQEEHPEVEKTERDASGKFVGRANTLKPEGGAKPGLLAGDAKPKIVDHGDGSGNTELQPLEPGGKSPSNKVVETKGPKSKGQDAKGPQGPMLKAADTVPQAKPPSGMPQGAGAKPPQSKPSMGGTMATAPKMPGGGLPKMPGLGKGLQDIAAGAHVGAVQGMTAGHALSGGSPAGVVIGGALGGLRGAIQAVRARPQGPQAPAAAAPAPVTPGVARAAVSSPQSLTTADRQAVTAHQQTTAQKGELDKAGLDMSLKTALMHDRTQGPPGTVAAAPAAVKMPSPAEHAQRASSMQDFMPAGNFGPAKPTPATAIAAAGAPAAKPAAPAPGAKPAAPAAGVGKPPPTGNAGIVDSQSGFGAQPKPLGAVAHLPKLTAVLNRGKARP